MFVSEVEFMLHKKQLNRVIKIQELKLKLLEKEIKINKIDTRSVSLINTTYCHGSNIKTFRNE